MDRFKKVLYSTNDDEWQDAYISLVQGCGPRHANFVSYVDKWLSVKERWCMAYRNGLMTRGHNTNNCCESTIRIIKDIVFNRCKAYNACQLIHFVNETYSEYFTNKILNAVLNRKRGITLERPPMPVEKINPGSNATLFKVTSERDESITYSVDIVAGTCTCPVGINGKMCKHQKSVLLHEQIRSDQLYQGTSIERYRFACMALEEDQRPSKEFFYAAGSSQQQSASVDEQQLECDVPCSSNQSVASNFSHSENEDYTAQTTSLLQSGLEQLIEKLGSYTAYREACDAAKKFNNAVESARSVGQLVSALHLFGSRSISYRGAARRIPCQPASLSRRRQGAAKCAAPLGKGRPPLQLKRHRQKRLKRKRNLSANILRNQGNAKGHGDNH